jgi:NADH-quinone oxidoreductase subunit M
VAIYNGSFEISDTLGTLAGWIAAGRARAWAVLGLFSMAFLTKAALFPFHMWPAFAHAEAPDDFSPFLSGVLIKYGIYGLFILWVPLFASTPAGAVRTIEGIPWPLYILGWFSALTAVAATLAAIFSNDAKRLLAWSTVATLGYIGTALSAHSVIGTAAALFHMANHMF